MSLLGTGVYLACQRSGCEAVETIEVTITDQRYDYGLGDEIADAWPDGWGWDVNGCDEVLHCPDHRTAAKS